MWASFRDRRHLVLSYAQSQPFDQGSLTDAWIADEDDVVLASTAQDMNGAVQLSLPADQRIEATLFRQRDKVDGKRLERTLLAGRLVFIL